MEKTVIEITLVALGICMLFILARVIKGPTFVDRIIYGNAISTLVVAVICLLSRLLTADYLVDVALIYALLSMVTNTLITRSIIAKRKKEVEAKWYK